MSQIAVAEVHNFQSIEAAVVEFPSRPGGGGITTITGPSSTGKSALLRAIRTCVRNTSSAPVRSGATNLVVSLTMADDVKVTLERGPGHSTYRIIRGTDEQVYAKSSTTVPEDVTTALGLRSGTPDPHFTFQFDRPHMLSEPGSAVNRIIGDLTNASVLSEAVREGSRRRLRSRQMSETRRADVKTSMARLQEFTGLGEKEKALQEARDHLGMASKLASKSDQAERMTGDWEAAEIGFAALKDRLRDAPDASVPLEAATDLTAQASKVAHLARLWDEAASGLDTAYRDREQLDFKARELGDQYVDLLRKMGRCPTCQQVTTQVPHA